tara:strand:- start:8992 stop:10086 length:1095 start_codon:yes stop_codon:yes gene_type:complete
LSFSSDNLIPFGEQTATGDLVDVGEVEKGERCNCICPSCKTPLIARKGGIKEWHFAHKSHARRIKKETEKPCDMSFAVSVRLMAKQLFECGAHMLLPKYEKVFSLPIPSFLPLRKDEETKTYIICDENMMGFSSVEIEQRRMGSVFDLILNVDGWEILVYITYQGRAFPKVDVQAGSRVGLIEINAMEIKSAFKNITSGQYKKALSNFLAQSYVGKKWRYHPRERRAEEDFNKYAIQRLEILKNEGKHNERTMGAASLIHPTHPSNQSGQAHATAASRSPKNKEEIEQLKKAALDGALNEYIVMLGSDKASEGAKHLSRERIMGGFNNFSENSLHKCLSCEFEWSGKTNSCQQCGSYIHSRSVI